MSDKKKVDSEKTKMIDRFIDISIVTATPPRKDFVQLNLRAKQISKRLSEISAE